MKKMVVKFVVCLLGATLFVALGYIFGLASGDKTLVKTNVVATDSHTHSGKQYACPMLCTILPEPGKCPVCGMEMLEIDDGPVIKLTGRAKKLAGLRVSTVKRARAFANVDLVGKVAYDESRMSSITTDFPGRIDKLYVDYIGMKVAKGDHVADLFSPELIVLQKEYALANKSYKSAKKNEDEMLLDMAKQQLESVKTKLKAWRLTSAQIKQVEASGEVNARVTLKAPIGGSVMQRLVMEGDYFKAAQKLFMIADTENLWILLDAYETDLKWLRYGQDVEFNVEAFPGETFKGSLIYIYPDMDEKSRTVKVRVNVSNKDGRLRPGMFAHAVIQVRVGSEGQVLSKNYNGKWLCQMHPEVLRDKPGNCPECGMKLVPTEKLPFVSTGEKKFSNPLLVPVSSTLVTGKRAVVYLQRSTGEYEGIEIKIGPRVGKYYVVLEGLKEGDVVVTQGAFKLDSEMQIRAKNNMMSYAGEELPQINCPVMGFPIDKKHFVDVKGKRIYVCCPSCIEKIKADPDKYIKQMNDQGIRLEVAKP